MPPKLRAGPRTPTRDELLAAVAVLFTDGERAEAVRVLDAYRVAPHVRETPERVQMAALGLSQGSLDHLRRNVDVACRDFRDILAPTMLRPWAEEFRAVEVRLGEAGLSPWKEWLALGDEGRR